MTSSIKELFSRPSGRTVDAGSYKGVGRVSPLQRRGGVIKWYAKTGVDHGIPSDVM